MYLNSGMIPTLLFLGAVVAHFLDLGVMTMTTEAQEFDQNRLTSGQRLRLYWTTSVLLVKR